MSVNSGRSTDAEILYVVALVNGPRTLIIRGVTFTIDGSEDACVLMRRVRSSTAVFEEKIVGIIGSEYRIDAVETLRLARFMSDGGVIGLHKELAL